jgi:carboxyl-terminal processing protease
MSGAIAGCSSDNNGSTQPQTHIPATAESVFRVGYAGIADRFIEPVSMETVAMEGLQGLAEIDRSLTLSRTRDELVLSKVDGRVVRMPAPRPDDSDGWAVLTAQAWSKGGQISEQLAAADPERVYEAVFDAAVSRLDAFSRYANAEEAQLNRWRRDGHAGIGIRFRLDGNIAEVTDVTKRGPADRAGLRPGDKVIHIDEVAVAGLSEDEVADRLGGRADTWVTLTVRRGYVQAPHRFFVHRELLIPETVTEYHGGGIVYINIKSFNQGTVGSLRSILENEIDSPKRRAKGLILDLRGNPGGLLDQSIKVADLFLERGPIIATRGRHPGSIHLYEAHGRDHAIGLPLVVLVDGGSASAAEIVAAALQDRGRAVVVGTASYGKGSVQTVMTLPNDGELILTWSRLVPPSGRVLQGRGVLPVICTSGIAGDKTGSVEQVFASGSAARRPGNLTRRGMCPPESRTSDLEVIVARRLLEDWSLYFQALHRTSYVAEALH